MKASRVKNLALTNKKLVLFTYYVSQTCTFFYLTKFITRAFKIENICRQKCWMMELNQLRCLVLIRHSLFCLITIEMQLLQLLGMYKSFDIVRKCRKDINWLIKQFAKIATDCNEAMPILTGLFAKYPGWTDHHRSVFVQQIEISHP